MSMHHVLISVCRNINILVWLIKYFLDMSENYISEPVSVYVFVYAFGYVCGQKDVRFVGHKADYKSRSFRVCSNLKSLLAVWHIQERPVGF